MRGVGQCRYGHAAVQARARQQAQADGAQLCVAAQGELRAQRGSRHGRLRGRNERNGMNMRGRGHLFIKQFV